MSFGELLFLSVLALLVFGPRKLPEIARLVGKTMAELRRASNEFRFSLEEEIRNAELQEQAKKAAVTFTPAPAVPSIAPTSLAGATPVEEAAQTAPSAVEPEVPSQAPEATGHPAPSAGVPGTVPAPVDPWAIPERGD